MPYDWVKARGHRITHDRQPDKSFLSTLRAIDPALEVVWDNYLKRWWLLRTTAVGTRVPIFMRGCVTESGKVMRLDGHLLNEIRRSRIPDRLLEGDKYKRAMEQKEKDDIQREEKRRREEHEHIKRTEFSGVLADRKYFDIGAAHGNAANTNRQCAHSSAGANG